MTYNSIFRVTELHNVDVDIYQDYQRKTIIVVILTYHGWWWTKKRTKRKIQAELNKQKPVGTHLLVVNNEINVPIHD